MGGVTIDFAYMGHHQEDSYLCAYNDAVNQTLAALIESNLHNYMLIDREAELEHINCSKSVYGDPRTVLAEVAWPNPNHLSVAKEAMDTADALSASSNRLVMINNLRGKELSLEVVNEMLDRHGLEAWPCLVFPPLDEVEERPVGEAVSENPAAQEVLKSLLAYLDQVKHALPAGLKD